MATLTKRKDGTFLIVFKDWTGRTRTWSAGTKNRVVANAVRAAVDSDPDFVNLAVEWPNMSRKNRTNHRGQWTSRTFRPEPPRRRL